MSEADKLPESFIISLENDEVNLITYYNSFYKRGMVSLESQFYKLDVDITPEVFAEFIHDINPNAEIDIIVKSRTIDDVPMHVTVRVKPQVGVAGISGQFNFSKYIDNDFSIKRKNVDEVRYRIQIEYGLARFEEQTWLTKWLSNHSQKNSKAVPINITEYIMKQDNRALETIEHDLTTEDFEEIYDELYVGLNIQNMIKSFMESSETLMILVGAAGCGKTSLIKKLFIDAAENEHSAKSCVYVKDKDVLHMAPFWARINSSEYDFLILDDLDKELTPRAETIKNGEQTIVNHLLSYTNGIFPTKTKVIITTNLMDEDIDSALMRPGRCFDVFQFPFMPKDYAKDLWIGKFGQSEETFEECFSMIDKEITQSHFMSELHRLEFQEKCNYITDLGKEKQVSVRSNYINKPEKRIGF